MSSSSPIMAASAINDECVCEWVNATSVVKRFELSVDWIMQVRFPFFFRNNYFYSIHVRLSN